jgi:predicted acylesterase/phospholipase RssA
MPRRLAITIAGAVSLGSYEAGVLYEVLKALGNHNTKAKSEDEKIYIDVITGASAGAMTAAIAMLYLLYAPDRLSGAEKNVFYEAWVERISLWSLVRMKLKEPIWHSLLSSNVVERIARQMLTDPLEKVGGLNLSEVHPAIELVKDANGLPKRDSNGNLIPKPLRLGMALTNLNGVNYGYPILEGRGERFQYTRSVDAISWALPDSSAEVMKLWTQRRKGAVASGAFPFAFRPQAIERNRSEFADATLEDWPFSEKSKTFAYSDGGVLQNQPIGLAKNLIEELVSERLSSGDMSAYNDADSRLYLFVSPHSLESQSSVFAAKNASFPRMSDALVRTYARQAEFHDWIMAEQLNQQVNTLDKRAKQLADVIESRQIDVRSLGAAAVQLGDLLAGSDPERIKNIERLKIQYRALYEKLMTIGADEADAWANSIFTLEAAANLQRRDRMNILAVMAQGRTDLAGAGICSFVGFFSRKFREHDYLFGRVKAREYLENKEVQRFLGQIELDDEKPANPSEFADTPVPLYRALWIGGPALAWIAIWRIIRWWPSAVGIAVLVALIILRFVVGRF